METSIWDNLTRLDALGIIRDDQRLTKPRLTFDCFKAKCREDRVYCSMGFQLGREKDGTMFLLSVLRGRTSSQCKSCKEFDGGE